MKCPKCNSLMREVSVVGNGSSLVREAQTTMHTGISCANCGKWLEIGIESSDSPKSVYDHQKGNNFREVSSRIRKEMTDKWACISDMRSQKIGQRDIMARLGIECGLTSFSRHLKVMEAPGYHFEA